MVAGWAIGGRALIRLDVSFGREEVFFDSPHEDFHPFWSADGERLAVVVRHDEGSGLYELSRSGKILRRLTH